MRPPVALLAVVGIAVVVVAGALFALGRTLGVGPFAPGAPLSWVYLAIARQSPDSDARDVEVIDFATGERQVFALEATRIFDLALSRDRRTLYVASTNGTILELDALRGAVLGEIQLDSTGEVRRLVVLAEGSRLVAVTVQALDSAARLVDLGTRREVSFVSLGTRLVGQSIAPADVLLSVSDRAQTEQVLALGRDPFRVREEVLIASSSVRVIRTAAPALVAAPDGSVVALSPFSLRLGVLSGTLTERRGIEIRTGIATTTSGVTTLVPGSDGDVTVSADGRVIHFCVGTGLRSERFTAPWDSLTPTRVGTECGRYVRLADGTLYLAVRGRPEVRVLNPATGEVTRTLALAGYAQRVAY